MGYVYRHVRLDKNEVFYIGIGLNEDDYKRAYSKDSRRSQHWRSIIKSTPYRVDIMFEDDDADIVKEKEKELIKLYGRRDLGLGTLVNFTDGGDGSLGHVLSEKQREAISDRMRGENNPMYGKTLSDKTKEKIRLSSTGRRHTDETKNKARERMLGDKNPNFGKSLSEEAKEKLRAANCGRTHSEETKAKLREMRLGELNPNYGKSLSEETREKKRIASTGKKHSEETKEMQRLIKLGSKNPMFGKFGKDNPIFGTKRSEESIRKLSEARRGKYTGESNHSSRLVVDLGTGIFYVPATEAHNCLNLKISINHFTSMLNGKYKNKTSCVYI